MAKDEFKHESLQDPSSIASYLDAIKAGIAAGALDLSDARSQIVLHPTGLLRLELRAKRKGNRSKLQLELSWADDEAASSPTTLHVNAVPPR